MVEPVGPEQRSGFVAEDAFLHVVSYSITAGSVGKPCAANAAPSAPPSR